jgi:hypothetical protein
MEPYLHRSAFFIALNKPKKKEIGGSKMAAIGGRLAKVMYGSVIIAGMGKWSLSGFIPDVLESTAFGDTVKTWVNAGIGDAGTVDFDGNYDPLDTAGQVALDALDPAVSPLELDNLYFYETANSFWRVAAGGKIVLTKLKAVQMAKNAIGTIAFSGKVSGKAMEHVS